MTELDTLLPRPTPTAARPLAGMTVLVVEDSRFACEALRLMGLQSGARIRRADCIASARRHLQLYRPSVAIVDMGLPDGSGAALIKDIANTTPRIPVILGISGDSLTSPEAIDAGADGFLIKPVDGVAAFQQAILENLPVDQRPKGPRPVPAICIPPDRTAFLDDLKYANKALRTPANDDVAKYLAMFLSGLGKSAGDDALHRAAAAVTEALRKKNGARQAIHKLSAIIGLRLEEYTIN